MKKNEEYKNRINELENIINKLKNQIIVKDKLLKEEKIKNDNLNVENDNLNKKIKEKDKLLKEQNIKNDNLNEKIKEKDNLLKEQNIKIDSLNKKIKEFEIEIISNKTKTKITELENEIKLFRTYYNFSPNEKLISIKFISTNQDIDFTIITKNSDEFSKIEKLLYDKYPKYKDSENYFLVNGNRINRHRTFEENKVRNNDVLTLEINNFD